MIRYIPFFPRFFGTHQITMDAPASTSEASNSDRVTQFARQKQGVATHLKEMANGLVDEYRSLHHPRIATNRVEHYGIGKSVHKADIPGQGRIRHEFELHEEPGTMVQQVTVTGTDPSLVKEADRALENKLVLETRSLNQQPGVNARYNYSAEILPSQEETP